jgi:HEAT repeat protein
MASTAMDELFAQTLHGEYDDDAPWQAIHALRRAGSSEVLERAAEWCTSDNSLKRSRGADVLAQLGRAPEHPTQTFPEECYAAIAQMFLQEKEEGPLSSAIYAFGHLDDPRSIPLILSQRENPSPDIRHAVAFALGSFANDPDAVRALLSLASDPDEDVRDWAVFALGKLGNADSAEIRDALYARLHDPNEDVREEAIVGLARRKDRRALPHLVSALEKAHANDSGIPMRILEAADAMLDLEKEREDWSLGQYANALRDRFSF